MSVSLWMVHFLGNYVPFNQKYWVLDFERIQRRLHEVQTCSKAEGSLFPVFWHFFDFVRFFPKLYNVSSGPPSFFRDLALEWMLKYSTGPPFHLFWHFETVRNYHFLSDTVFLNIYLKNILSKFWRLRFKKISLYPILLTLCPNYIAFYWEGGVGSKKRARICLSTIYPNFSSVFRVRKAPFGCFETFLSFS